MRSFVCSSNIFPVRCAGQHRGCARHEQVAAEVGHGRVRGGAAGARRDGERGAAGGGRLGGEDEDERSVLRPRLPAVRQRHHLRQQVPAGQVSSDGFVLILSSVKCVFSIQLKTNRIINHTLYKQERHTS